MLRLRFEREKRGMSQTRLSQLTGIAASDISAIENRWKRAYPGWKKRIGAALGFDAEQTEKLFEEVRDDEATSD